MSTHTRPWRRLGPALLLAALCAGCPDDGAEPTPDAQPVDAAQPDPDAAQPDPDAARPDPDAARPEPDAAAPDPDAARPEPDAAAPDPDAAVPDPDAAVPDPDAAVPDPDAAVPDPDAAVPDPDAAPPEPDAAPPEPDLGPPVGNPLLPAAPNRTCALPEPPPLGAYRTERAFPNLNFSRPIWLGTAPGEPGRLYVVEQSGAIYAFDNDQATNQRTRFLQLAVLRSNNEEGLLGLAFHPDYAANGRFFVHYSTRGGCPPGVSRCSVIAEYARGEDGLGDPDSEVRLMVVGQPFGNHNGGDLRFGPDGYLYISLGDGGSAGDPLGHGQNTDTLLGSLLRIDVDREEGDRLYGIPPDNPFADGQGGQPEIWAWGLRNIWRMAFDPSTGLLWAGDVGQNAYEEIDIIDRPGNYGWNVLEGNDCYGPLVVCDDEDMVPPVWVYPHAQGRSVTGGVVYRGPDLPELWGSYVFGDYVSGRIWALEQGADGEVAVEQIATRSRVTHFGTDAAGRVYITTFHGDAPIIRIVRAEPPEGPPFPELLSETGCFDDVASLTLAPGVVPYQLNRPFWSDGALKLRAIALPEGTQVAVDPDDPDANWRFPVGTVLIKTFIVEADVGGAFGPRVVATRLYTRQVDGWRGFVYQWNDAQDEAVLLDSGALLPYGAVDGPREWIHPDRVECDQCHTSAAGFALGFDTRQLAGEFELNGLRYDQLDALAEIGLLDAAPAERPAHPRPAGDAEAAGADLEAAARSAIAINCAPCHQPEGGANASLDLRVDVPLAETGLCRPPGQGDLGIADARLVAPGDRQRSVVWQRMNRRDGEGMPPIGSNRVDEATVELVGRWIDGLPACPQ